MCGEGGYAVCARHDDHALAVNARNLDPKCGASADACMWLQSCARQVLYMHTHDIAAHGAGHLSAIQVEPITTHHASLSATSHRMRHPPITLTNRPCSLASPRLLAGCRQTAGLPFAHSHLSLAVWQQHNSAALGSGFNGRDGGWGSRWRAASAARGQYAGPAGRACAGGGLIQGWNATFTTPGCTFGRVQPGVCGLQGGMAGDADGSAMATWSRRASRCGQPARWSRRRRAPAPPSSMPQGAAADCIARTHPKSHAACTMMPCMGCCINY